MAIELNKQAERTQKAKPERKRKQRERGASLGLGKRISGRDMIYFTSQLSLMLEVGTALTDAMHALASQTQNPRLRRILDALEQDLEAGASLSGALAKYPAVFDGVFVSMVQAGETGGYLRDALERIVEMREKREALIAQVKASLTYPIILSVVSAVVIVFVLTGVLPKFMPLFEGKEAILPGSTRFMMATSNSLRGYWWAWLVGLAGGFAGVAAFLGSPPGLWMRDRVALSAPILGRLTNKVLTGQLLRTLGHLLESHVELLDALDVTRVTLPNRFYRALVDDVRQTVEGGGRLAQAFLRFQHMPNTVRQMIATGEESGNLYVVMVRLAAHYDGEVEQELKRLASMIEPLALIVLGSVVGLIVASIILPMFKLAHAIG